MRMTKIRLIGLSTIDLPVVDADPTDAYILKSSEGLGPPEINVSISETLHSGVYQGRRPHLREIVLHIGLNPDYAEGQTAGDLRSLMYGLLTPGSADKVEIHILDGETLQATAVGYVRNLEVSPFSKDPEVQITFACLHPYLQGPRPIFVSPGLTDRPVIVNSGTAPTGFSMSVVFTVNRYLWTLTNSRGERMHFNYSFVAGDRLTFDTNYGRRTITLERGVSDKFNLMYTLSSDSTWLQLYGGRNVFTSSSAGLSWGDVFYTPQYWGI